MNKLTKILFSLLVAILLFAPIRAHAQCSSPTGTAGSQIFNTAYNLMQYCNGTDWVSMGSSGKATSSIWQTSGSNIFYDLGSVGIGTSTPASTLHVAGGITAEGAIQLANDSVVIACASAGAVRYNAGKASIEVCDGTSWKTSSAGGFTQGSVPFADGAGDLTEDNPNLNWDNTEKELTVGNMITFKGADGGEPLISNPMIEDLDNVTITAPADGHILTYNSGGWENIANTSLWQENGANIYFDAGDVGIGTTSPTSPLHVAGTVRIGNSFFATDQGGSIELGAQNLVANTVAGGTPFIDFHYGNGAGEDYNARIVNAGDGVLNYLTSRHYFSGNVGIGTGTPTEKLSVSGLLGVSSGMKYNSADGVPWWIRGIGNGPAILLQKHTGAGAPTDRRGALGWMDNNSVYYEVLNWNQTNVGIGTNAPTAPLDIANQLQLAGASATPPTGMGYGLFHYSGVGLGIYSGAVGSTQGIGIWTNYGGTPKENIRILSNGNMGIGTTNPGAKLHIVNGDTSDTLYGPNTTWGATLRVGAGTDNNISKMAQVFSTNGNLHLEAARGYKVYINHYTTGADVIVHSSVHVASDRRWKKDIVTIDSALDKLKNIRGVYYNWKDNRSDKTDMGVIAQEIEKEFPEIVTEMNTDEYKGYKTVQYERLTAPLIEAVKELADMHNKKDQKIKSLEKRIEQLETLIKEQK